MMVQSARPTAEVDTGEEETKTPDIVSSTSPPTIRRGRGHTIVWDIYKLSTIRRELRKGATIRAIAEMIEVSEAALGQFLRASTDPTIKGALTINKKMRSPPTPPKRPNYEAVEKTFFDEYGLTLADQSDLNIGWMRERGYTHDMKNQSERARTRMLKERREEKSRRFG